MVQPRSVFAADPQRVHYDGGRFHYVGLAALRNFHVPLAEAEGTGAVEVDVAISLSLFVDRELLLRRGAFDEHYVILYEDLDLSWRVRAAGHAILCAEDTLVVHDTGTPELSFRGGTDYPARRVFFNTRNRARFLYKNLRTSTWFLIAPGLFLYDMLWLGFALRQGGFGAWCRGQWEHARALPELQRARRGVQSARVVGDRELLVGGPLTITPSLRGRGVSGAALSVVDRLLSTWFRVVRRAIR
jgi:GT2 family glycosyltransferase